MPGRNDENSVRTAGEVQSDASFIELIASKDSFQPKLLLYKDGSYTIHNEIEHDGVCYRPPELNSGIWRATQLPAMPIPYGTDRELLGSIENLCQQLTGFSSDEARDVARWCVCTHFPELISNPPDMLLFGPDMAQAVECLRSLQCVVRHPLLLTEIRSAALRRVVERFVPTVLINQPDMSPQTRRSLAQSNYRGISVLDGSGRASQMCCFRAMYRGIAFEQVENPSAVRLTLPPARQGRMPITETDRAEIGREYLGKLMQFRFNNFAKLAQDYSVAGTCADSRPIEENTVLPIWEDLRMIMRSNASESVMFERSLEPAYAVVEVLLAVCHQTASNLQVTDLAGRVNALLRTRGEIKEYSSVEIGKILAGLGIKRSRKGPGMYIEFDALTGRSLHQLARSFGVEMKAPGCSDCKQTIIQDGVSGNVNVRPSVPLLRE